jgi:hypothetical protein
MLVAGLVYSRFQLPGYKGALFASDDGEIVIREVNSRVSFRRDRSAKENQILGQGCMQNRHGSLSLV